jgi:hypothetical protein
MNIPWTHIERASWDGPSVVRSQTPNTESHINAVRLNHDLPAFLQHARYTSAQRKRSRSGTKPNMLRALYKPNARIPSARGRDISTAATLADIRLTEY